MGAFNSLEFLIFGVAVFCIFPMIPFQIQPEGGFGLGQISTALIPLLLRDGVFLSMTVLLTLRGVLFSPVLYEAVSVTSYCIAGVLRTCGSYRIPVFDVQSRFIVCANTRFHRRIQHRDFLVSNPDLSDVR